MKKLILLSCLFLLALCTIASADTTGTINLLSKAKPDECFADPGVNYPNGITGYLEYWPNAGPPCPATTPAPESLPVEAKTNQTYVWGLTRAGNSLWLGTGANVVCTTEAGYLGAIDALEYSSAYVCEFGESQLLRTNPQIVSSAQRGDWRPPKVYEYQLRPDDPFGIFGTLVDRTPTGAAAVKLLRAVMGFRAAGSHNGVVFMAGGARTGGGIIMFAFDADTKQYLGSQRFTQYGTTSTTSIRKFLVIQNQLYTAIGGDLGIGYILRWTGSKTNPFSFVQVGRIIGLGRELAEYTDSNGRPRLAVSAQGLYLSPAITSSTGLPQSTRSWTMVWTPWNYEPDATTAYGYGGGGVHQFDGWLYWGTMHIPGRGAYLHENCPYSFLSCFGTPQSDGEESILRNGTARATTIWRGRNLESTSSANRVIELLYGENYLPMFNPDTRTFDLTPTGWTPAFCDTTITSPDPNIPDYCSSSGFTDPAESIKRNSNNGYTWTMKVANGKLFMGTLDTSGADLWRIDPSSTCTPVNGRCPAKRENGSGLGNSYMYGIRTMETSADGKNLYAGMATMSNLGTYGGWELRALTFGPFVASIPSIYVNDAAGTPVSTSGGAFAFTDSATVSSISIATPPGATGTSLTCTVDGTEPTDLSPLCSTYTFNQTATLKARAFAQPYPDSGPPSGVTTATFTKFDFSVSDGEPVSVQQGNTVTKTFTAERLPNYVDTTGVYFDRRVIAWSTDDGITWSTTLPTGVSSARFSPSTCYPSPTCTTTLTIITTTALPVGEYLVKVTGKAGSTAPLTVERTITFQLTVTQAPQVDMPVISFDPPDYVAPLTVSITTTTPGASIWYTLDGSDPTEGSPSIQYLEPIVLTETGGPMTLKAKGFLGGYLPSGVASAEFTIIPQAPSGGSGD
jgi:hypothetical protein